MPKDIQTVNLMKLGSVCKLITDGKHGDCRNEDGSGYYFLSAKDVRDGKLIYRNARQITKEDFLQTHRRTQFEQYDILIVSTGATIGRMAIANDNEFIGRTTFQKSVAILKPNRNIVLPHWLFYKLNHLKENLINLSGGTAQGNLLLRDLRDFLIEVPSLPIQRKIAAILSAFDDLIENNTRRIRILEEMAHSIYCEWFVHYRFPGHENVRMVESDKNFGKVPKGWNTHKLIDFVTFTKGIEPGSNNYLECPGEKTVPFLRVGDLGRRDSNIYIREEVTKGKLVREKDIVISLDGTVGIVRMGLSGCYSSGIRKVVFPNNSLVGWAYIYILLQSKQIQDVIHSYARGTTILHAGAALDNLLFRLPPHYLMKNFEEKVSSMLEMILNLEKINHYLRITRDLLLPKLVSGEVDVSELDISGLNSD